jgi:hypothetical protein
MKIKKYLFLLYFLVCFLANVWPIALIANRIEPFIFGLPFFIFWAVLWSLLIFIGIVALYLSEKNPGIK